MRRTITLLATTAALAAAITGSASAATLYTTSAHTTPVAVGTQFTILSTNYANYAAPYGLIAVCGGSQLYFTVAQNSGGVFKASVTGGALTSCSNGWGSVPAGGTLQISGSAITVGTRKAWLATTLTGSQTMSGSPSHTYAANFTSATGNPPVNGIWTEQPTTGGTPLSIMLNNAPSLTSPGQLTMNVSATYNPYTPAAAQAYSLG
jgi:hypothetical protein